VADTAWKGSSRIRTFASARTTRTEGALITHPDADPADAQWNSSGVPWHTMYYNGNYAQLQSVKARWDPNDVFHHSLSIRIPAGE
jgi:aclacinomycin oxidase